MPLTLTGTHMMDCARRLTVAALLALGVAATQAQEVGEVTFVQGVTSAQRPGQEARFLAKGDSVNAGEVVNTSGRGFAVLGLKDGTRMTLRSNTTFVIDQLNQTAGSESLVMNLVRGGLRAVTGLISKASSRGVRLTTPTATVGIRGTEFDARICGPECRREAQYARPGPQAAPQDLVVARVVLVSGIAQAVGSDGAVRTLAQGAALRNGESVRTAADSHAVLAFRDQTKVTLIPQTDFRLEDIRFSAAQPDQGNFLARLVTGGLRSVTGLIGKANSSRVKFVTPTATVGIRGTGLDIRLTADGTLLYTWDGTGTLDANAQQLAVEKDRAGVLDGLRQVPELLPEVPQAFLDERSPRPDQVVVDIDALFAVRRLDDVVPGLYVGVRSGNVNLATARGFVDLGPLESALLADGSDQPLRIEPLPGFLFNDPFPLPDDVNLRPLRMIELVGPGRDEGSDQCMMR